MADRGPLPQRGRDWRVIARIAGVASLVLIAISLFWQASESHYRSCLQRASVRYPAVPVSAFAAGGGRGSPGPLKVSFVDERKHAVAGCGHF